MEHFAGSLEKHPLQFVVPALFRRGQPSGELRIRRGATQREFSVSRGQLIAVRSNEPREHLAQVLSDLRLLDLKKSAAAFWVARSKGMPFGALLVEKALITEDALRDALTHKAKEAYFDCVDWKTGDAQFIPSTPATPPGVALCLPLGALHREAIERVKQWRQFRELFRSLEVTFAVNPGKLPEPHGPHESALLSLAEKGAALGDLLVGSGEGRFAASRRIVDLFRAGALVPRKGRVAEQARPRALELLDASRELLGSGDYEMAARLAAQVLERENSVDALQIMKEAELQRTLALSDEVLALEGRLTLQPLPSSLPQGLTADDLYLYAELMRAPSVREALRGAAMGEAAAYLSVKRLISARLASVAGDDAASRFARA